MANVTIVRHAQASFGTDDYDKLSPLGHQQSEWLGAYFQAHGWSFDRVVRGDLRRHRETLAGIERVIGAHETVVDQRFDEFHYDPLQAEYMEATGSDAPANRPEFLAMMPDIFDRWSNGDLKGSGESYHAFADRVRSGLKDHTEPGENLLIVTSGGVIGNVLQYVLDLSVRSTADLMLNIHNASIHRFTLENGTLRLSQFNGSPHLDPVDRAHARTYV